MSDSSHDKVRSFLPSDDEIEKALEAALKEGAAGGPGMEGSLQDVRPNTAVKGTVLRVTADRVIVDLHYKSEGVVPLAEFGENVPAPGAEIEAWVMALEDADGDVALSVAQAQRRKLFDAVASGAGSGEVFTGKVEREVKGGLIVDLGMEAFMPAREVDLRYVEDLGDWVGRRVDVEVIESDPARRRVVVSRRALLAKRREAEKGRLFETLEEGQTVRGTVTNITNFGAFVDIGGAEGLLHVGDMAWGRVDDPKEIVTPGQELELRVLKFDPGSGKISLGLKQTSASPWDRADDRFAPGRRFKGKVTGMLEFGALVEIEPGVTGLVHVSEMRWGKRVNRPTDVVSIGDEVEVEVLELDPGKQKVSLSMKKVEENPWTSLANKYPVPSGVHGRVTRLADFGAFVEIEEGVEGLIHVSELSWTERFDHPSQRLAVGDEVAAMVIGIDEERQRLRLSLRATEPDPWWDVEETFPAGRAVEGTVKRLAPFGAFVLVDQGPEGLVHVSQMGAIDPGRGRIPVRVGDRVRVEVLEASEEERRMGLRLLEIL